MPNWLPVICPAFYVALCNGKPAKYIIDFPFCYVFTNHTGCIFEGEDVTGTPLGSIHYVSANWPTYSAWENCAQACSTRLGCTHYTFELADKMCHMKTVGAIVWFGRADVISGTVFCSE